jgi:hypothetical protein
VFPKEHNLACQNIRNSYDWREDSGAAEKQVVPAVTLAKEVEVT